MINKELFTSLADIAEGISLPQNDKSLNELLKQGMVSINGEITDFGIHTLEPYKVKRACFLAAGFGQRLSPITLNTPKPLVNVNGIRIIETLLNAVVSEGIKEIYIAVGYLAEQFELLKRKYPMITLVNNPYYETTNNISSAIAFGDKVRNSYIIESDIFLKNPKLIKKYQYDSNIVGIPMKHTDDYCLFTKDGYISGMGIGGDNCYQTVGITYWTDSDGARLANQLKEFFDRPDGKQVFFGSIPTKYHVSDYKISIRECSLDDVQEIDSFEELKMIDPRYK